MSEQDTQPEETQDVIEGAPADDATPANEQADAQAAPDVEQADDDADDWRENFDPDRARRLIAKLREEKSKHQERARKAEEKAAGADEKDQALTVAEQKILKYEVGYDLGLPKELVNRLHGSTREELIDDAKSLLELVKPPARTTRKPIEALRGGGEPEKEPEETDVRKIGERIFSR